LVSYYYEEAMLAAPQDNVISTSDNSGWYYLDEGIVYYPTLVYRQTLHFEDIASIPDPCERFAARKRSARRYASWPGVKYAEYNGYQFAWPDAEPTE
jgi:hypothetical protein